MKKYYIYKLKLAHLNILSFVLLMILLFFTFFVNSSLLLKSFWIDDFFVFVLEIIIYLCLHEIFHCLAYVIHGAKYRNIVFGASLENGLLYCLCKENISKKNILFSLLYPLIFLGIVTYIVALIFNLPRLLLLSIMNISGCSGDIEMFMFIKKLKNIEFSEFDSPSEFAIYTGDDLSKRKSFGLEFIKSSKRLKKTYLKKVSVSEPSVVIFLILLIIGIVKTIIE